MRSLDEARSLCADLVESGDDLGAFRAYRAALRHHPDDTLLLVGFASLLIAYHEDSEALPFTGRLVTLEPEVGRHRLLHSQALSGAGQSDEALEHLKAATQDQSCAAEALAMLGYWYQARGRFQESRVAFEQSILAGPHRSLGYFGLIQSHRVGDLDSSFLDSVLEERERAGNSHDAMVFEYVLGKAYGELKQFEASMDHYDRANALARANQQGGQGFDVTAYGAFCEATVQTFTAPRLKPLKVLGFKGKLPIFIVGMMRSGTTLLEQIVSSHAQVAAGGELKFWTEVQPQIFDWNQRELDEAAFVRATEGAKKILRKIAGEKAFVTDKMPQNIQAIGLIHSAFPKAPIIHVTRDPVDTCLSIYFTPYETSPDFAHDKADIVEAYRGYQRLAGHWREVVSKGCWMDVRYEDLVSDPETWTRKVIDFCGLPWSDNCLSPEENERLIETPSLWQARQPIYKTSKERWRSYEPWLGDFARLIKSEASD